MRAVFFCVAALSVTWCDLAWVFLGGAIVAAVARVAVSKTTITMRRLEVARQFIISTYVTGFFTLLARYFSGCASRSISMRLWTEFAKGSNFRKFGPVWFQLRRVRSTEIDIGEVCKAGHSFAEVRPVEVCVVEVRPRKVCPT